MHSLQYLTDNSLKTVLVGYSFNHHRKGISSIVNYLDSRDFRRISLEMNKTDYNNGIEEMMSRMSFDPSNVCQGPTIFIKRCEYTGFASNVYSVEQAIEILEYIGFCTQSENCLPFAVSLVNGAGEYINLSEDNGEFGAGGIIEKCLKKLDGNSIKGPRGR